MALVNCRECGGEVAKEAGKCPHCGVSRPYKGYNARIWILVIALIVVWQIGGFFLW